MSSTEMDRSLNAQASDEESFLTFQNSQGMQMRGTPLRIARFQVVFELYNPAAVLQSSEALTDFQVILMGRPRYSGRAVLRNVVHTGSMLVCEATIEDGWLDVDLSSNALEPQFRDFLETWSRVFRILPEYKLIIADMQTFLFEMRQWLDQVELGIRSAPSGDRLDAEQRVIGELSRPMLPAIDNLFA